ncbi:MAG: PIN domain-containing protein [Bacteroidales bacterium]|nr:PIN domain-containing protein [Bacteroidales bacterium]
MKTYIEKLEDQISSLIPLVDNLCNNSTIYYSNPNSEDSNVVFLGFDHYVWGKKDLVGQLKLKEIYLKFIEDFNFLLSKANKQFQREIEKVNLQNIHIIEQSKAYSTIEGTKTIFKNNLKKYSDYLNILKNSEEKQTIIIPDTNSLIQNPDPVAYRKLLSMDDFDFVILPTVLSELDKLKISHRDELFRNKVKSVIKRLKGFRIQGDLLEGVTIDKTIIVKMIASEPNFTQTLNWLDSENMDDRIIASALEIQKSKHSSLIVIVTGDINLQNKAQMANFEFIDSDNL